VKESQENSSSNETSRFIMQAKMGLKIEEGSGGKRLGKDVSNILFSWNIGDADVAILRALTNIVSLGVDVFCAGVEAWIFG
jgi:hypothetical protein